MLKRILLIILTISINYTVASASPITQNKKTLKELIEILRENLNKQTPIDKVILDEAFKLEKEIHKNPELIQLKGIYFFHDKNNVLAKKYLLLAEEYFMLPRDNNLLALNKMYLGGIYNNLDERKKGKQFYKESLAIYKRIGNINKARILERLLILEEKYEGNIEESLKKLQSFLKDTKKQSIRNQAQDIYFALYLYLESDNLKLAKERITEENKQIVLLDSNKISTGMYFVQLSDYYAKINKPKQALKYLDTVSYYLKQTKRPINTQLIYTKYAELYKGLKDITNYTIYKDSIYNLRRDIQIKNQKANINELEEAKNYTKLIGHLKHQKKIQIGVIIFTIVTLIFILFLFKKQYQQYKKKNHLLKNKNIFIKENYDKLLSSYKTSNERLKIIQTQLNDTNKQKNNPELNDISKDLKIFLSNTEAENITHLNNLQEEFTFKLALEFPSLIDIEIYVCFLMKLNLKTANIALTLNRTQRSIESIKFRIRKKIKLQTTKTLEEIISAIHLKKLNESSIEQN